MVLESTPVLINAPLQINIVARQRAWMRVVVDGEVAYEGRVMRKRIFIPWNERIELLTGNGQACRSSLTNRTWVSWVHLERSLAYLFY